LRAPVDRRTVDRLARRLEPTARATSRLAWRIRRAPREARPVIRLVVNADALALTLGINDGIARAHRDGIVTSASLMVRQPAAEAAAELVHDLPNLGIGLHADLAEWVAQSSGWAPV